MTAITASTLADTQEITLHLSGDAVARLNAAVASRHDSIESVVTELIEKNLPPVKQEDSQELDSQIYELSKLSEEELLIRAEAKLTENEQARLSQLTAKSKHHTLSEQEIQDQEALLDRIAVTATTRVTALWLLQQRKRVTGKP